MSTESGAIERLLVKDRQIVMLSLVIVSIFAWSCTVAGVGMNMNAFEMTFLSLNGVEQNRVIPSMNAPYVLLMLAMWWIMMIAMMLPSAAPNILLAAALNRRSKADQPPYGKTAFFVSGYLTAWFIFSLMAVAGQLVLERSGLMTAMMQSSQITLSAALLLAAGFWQFSVTKLACLRHCQSPVEYLTRYRRPGNIGAFSMGLRHGTFCLGCCWLLMLLLFVGGIMNLFWVAGLAMFVLLEKVFARGDWFSRLAGGGLIVSGLVMLGVDYL